MYEVILTIPLRRVKTQREARKIALHALNELDVYFGSDVRVQTHEATYRVDRAVRVRPRRKEGV